MTIQESGEMYLETILVLGKKNAVVRAVDIAEHLGVSKPAVSKTMARFRDEKLIVLDAAGGIALTEQGLIIAEMIYERHVCLTDFLMRLGVDEETASADACKIEHVISEKSFNAMKAHNEKHSKNNTD